MILNENQIDILLECQFLLSETTIKSHYTGSDFNYAKKLNQAIDNIKNEKQQKTMIKKIEKALVEVDFFINQFKEGDDFKTNYRKIGAGGSNELKIMLPIGVLLAPLVAPIGPIIGAALPAISNSIRASFMKKDDKREAARKYEKELKAALAKVKRLKFD